MGEQNSVSERSRRISRLLNSQKSRTAYIKAKLGVLVPAQIRALRLQSTNPPMPYQKDLARESEIKQQSRISMLETPGAANMTLETLAKVAAGLRVGVIVKFVPHSEMLRWENSFSPDVDVTRLENDREFLNPAAVEQRDLILYGTFGGIPRKFDPGNTIGESAKPSNSGLSQRPDPTDADDTTLPMPIPPQPVPNLGSQPGAMVGGA